MLKDDREVSDFLGICVKRDTASNTITLTQTGPH